MTWVAVGEAGAVAEGQASAIESDGHKLAVCHAAGGFYTIDDLCTHDGGSLDQGRLVGNSIECPRHGARFDIVTGRALTLPAVRPVKSYPTRVTAGQIEVDLP